MSWLITTGVSGVNLEFPLNCSFKKECCRSLRDCQILSVIIVFFRSSCLILFDCVLCLWHWQLSLCQSFFSIYLEMIVTFLRSVECSMVQCVISISSFTLTENYLSSFHGTCFASYHDNLIFIFVFVIPQVTLEKVLGITAAGNRALACDPRSGLVAYPAGWVTQGKLPLGIVIIPLHVESHFF